MLERLRSFFKRGPEPPNRRGLEAAAGGYRWNSSRPLTSLPREIERGSEIIRGRVQNLVVNDALASTAVDQLVAQLVGAGIRPRPAHPSAARRTAILKAHTAWARRADAEGRLDWFGLQAASVRSMITLGEAFLRIERGPDRTVPFRLRLLDPRLVPAVDQELPTGARLRAGVEVSPTGERLAYHLRPLDGSSLEPIRVPASEMIHLFRPLAPGQMRGLSWLSPILMRLQDVADLQDARLVTFKSAALYTASIETPAALDGSAPFDPDPKSYDVGLEPGSVFHMLPGDKLTFNQPPSPDESYQHYLAAMLTQVAACLGLTYEQLTGDTSRSNFSSSRVALLNQAAILDPIQHGLIVPQLVRPIWEKFIAFSILNKAFDAPDFASFPDDYAAEFHPPTRAYVDPEKEVNALRAAIDAGLTSRAQVVSQQGYDVEQIDAERAADAAREASFKLKETP